MSSCCRMAALLCLPCHVLAATVGAGLRENVCTTASVYQSLHCCQEVGCSGGFRNLERGVQPLARETQPKIFGGATPTSGT